MKDRDEEYMRRALSLASRALGRTAPNPVVGAVVVKDSQIVGEAYHRRAGGMHAEVLALQAAGAAGRDADLYVNLEPCCHHGRTPPCTDAIIRAGVRRVVVGTIDPNPIVRGRGLEQLEAAGVEISTGVLAEKCERLNGPFFLAMQHGRPQVTLKSAMTLDGCVATFGGDSKWITGPRARQAGHRLRARHDAIAVGIGSVLADDPSLTCRGVRGGRDPIRIVFDTGLRTPPEANIIRVVEHSPAPTWILCDEEADSQQEKILTYAGANIVRIPARAEGLDVHTALRTIYEKDVLSLLLEGGPTLAGSFWREKVVDRIVTFVAPKIAADGRAMPMIRGAELDQINDARALTSMTFSRVGEDFMIRADVNYPASDPES